MYKHPVSKIYALIKHCQREKIAYTVGNYEKFKGEEYIKTIGYMWLGVATGQRLV